MYAFVRSARITRSFCVVLVSLVLAAGRPTFAQDSDASSDSAEPVIVVTLGSVNKLMQDVNYISGISGQPQAGGIFALMAGTYTQGIDTTQPIAITVPLVDGMPQPLALIPTPDVKSVLKRLEAQTGPVDELKDGTLVIAVGVNTIYIRQQGNWAVVAPDRDVLDLAPADPATLFGEDGDQYDLSVKLRMQQVPGPIRSMITSQMRLGFEQAMAQQGSPETDAARDMAETSLTQIEQLLNDTDELQFGFNIDQAAKQMSFKARFTAVPGTSLGEILSSQEAIPSQFASVIRPDAAAFYHSASAIGPESVQQVQSSMKAASASIAGVLESQANLPQEYQQKVMGLVDRILDLASASAAEGKSDLGAVLLAGENSMQFALGTFVSNGNDVAAIAKDLAAEIEGVPGAPAFMFDQEVYEGVTMHLVEIDIPPFEEEMIEVLGEKLQIHIGTGEKAVYLATGKGSKALLTSMIDSAGQDKSSSRPVGQLHFSLMPMLELAQSVNADDSVMAMIDSLSRAADTGKIMMISESIENGQDFTLSIGEGLLQAAGAAARQEQLEAQRNAIQNGQF